MFFKSLSYLFLSHYFFYEFIETKMIFGTPNRDRDTYHARFKKQWYFHKRDRYSTDKHLIFNEKILIVHYFTIASVKFDIPFLCMKTVIYYLKMFIIFITPKVFGVLYCFGVIAAKLKDVLKSSKTSEMKMILNYVTCVLQSFTWETFPSTNQALAKLWLYKQVN